MVKVPRDYHSLKKMPTGLCKEVLINKKNAAKSEHFEKVDKNTG